MSILVTGASGFVGRYVVQQLAEAGQRVVALDPLPARTTAPGVVAVQGDVRDLRELLRLCREHGVDRIIHLASLLAPASQADPYRALEVNVVGTQNVFEAALLLDMLNVTWASSLAVFGHRHPVEDLEILTARSRHSPDNAYGWTKSYAEGISLQYRSQYGLPCVGLRIGLVYGHGKERGEGKFTENLFDRPARGEDAVVPYGDDTFCWQYVVDVARVFVEVSRLDRTEQGIYNIPGTVASMQEAVGIVQGLLPDTRLAVEPGTLGFPHRFDSEPLRRLLGDSYSLTTLRDGFAETLQRIAADARGNGDITAAGGVSVGVVLDGR